MEEQVKTARRTFAILMALMPVFVLVASCQTIDGACWLPDGQGPGSGASGPIIQTGVGGNGDTPPGEGGYGAGYVPCPATEQPTTGGGDAPGALKVFCKTPDMGAVCQSRCLAKEIPCGSIAYQPYKAATGGTGKLFSCNTIPTGYMCGFHYPNGDDCYFYSALLPIPPFCSYSGND
jgi:hypothetical protein